MNDAGEQLYIYEIEDQLKEARENLLKGTELMNRATLELEAKDKLIDELMDLAVKVINIKNTKDVHKARKQAMSILNNKEGE